MNNEPKPGRVTKITTTPSGDSSSYTNCCMWRWPILRGREMERRTEDFDAGLYNVAMVKDFDRK
jgi:hypothetical protein